MERRKPRKLEHTVTTWGRRRWHVTTRGRQRSALCQTRASFRGSLALVELSTERIPVFLSRHISPGNRTNGTKHHTGHSTDTGHAHYTDTGHAHHTNISFIRVLYQPENEPHTGVVPAVACRGRAVKANSTFSFELFNAKLFFPLGPVQKSSFLRWFHCVCAESSEGAL